MMGENTVVSIRIENDRLQMLQTAAVLLDSTPNELVREGVDMWLAKFAKRKDLDELRQRFADRSAQLVDGLLVPPGKTTGRSTRSR